MQMECSLLQLRVQYEFGFRNENVMQMKMSYFKNSCLINCHKMLIFLEF